MSLSPATIKMIQSKMKGLEWFTTLLPYESMELFSRRSIAANSKLVLDVMDVLVTCKNKEDPIKNESTRVVTIFSPL